MSSSNSPLLWIDVSARRWEQRIAHAALLVLVVLGAAVAATGEWVAAGLMLIAACFSGAGLRHARGRAGGRTVQRLLWSASGTWQLHYAGGACAEARLLDGARTAAGCWVWLRFRAHGMDWPACSLLLGPGDVPGPGLRQLIVRLHRDYELPERSGSQPAVSRTPPKRKPRGGS